MKKMEPKLIIFDMDGVVLNSEPLHQNAREMMFVKYGIVPDEKLPNPVGKSSSGFWEIVLETYGLKGDPDELEAEQYDLVAKQIRDDHIPTCDGLMEVLKWVKDKEWKIGLASSSTRRLVNNTLTLLGVKDYFTYSASGDEVENKKPAPDVYYEVLRMAGVDASEAVAVEDSRVGVEAAKAAGVYCYGYRNETSGQQDLGKSDVIISHLKEIMEKEK